MAITPIMTKNALTCETRVAALLTGAAVGATADTAGAATLIPNQTEPTTMEVL